MEDSIIVRFFERSQHPINELIYLPRGYRTPQMPADFDGSFLEYRLRKREREDREDGRFADVREHPFYPAPEDLILSFRHGDQQDVARVVLNRNEEIMKMWLDAVKVLCRPGDDREYGTSVSTDVEILQHVSSRVHFGEFVAESKFRSSRGLIRSLIASGEIDALTEALRDREVERKVAERVGEKGARYDIDPQVISDFYVNSIIPLTISVEVEYLLKRSEMDAEPMHYLRVQSMASKLRSDPRFEHASEADMRRIVSRMLTGEGGEKAAEYPWGGQPLSGLELELARASTKGKLLKNEASPTT